MNRIAWCWVLSLGVLAAQEFPRIDIYDRLVFARGDTLAGFILNQTADEVVLQSPTSAGSSTYPMSVITSVLPRKDPEVVFLGYYAESKDRPAASSLELARWADSYDLPAQARRAALRAVELDPGLADAYRLWYKLVEDGNFDAETYAEELMVCGWKAREGGAEPLDIGLKRCRSLLELGHLHTARVDLESLWVRVGTASPDSVAVGLGLLRGEAALADGAHQDARDHYRLVGETWPDLPEGHFGLAAASFALGDAASAAAALEVCDELGGVPGLAMAQAAVALAQGKLQALSGLLAAPGDSAASLYLMGMAGVLDRRSDEAARLFDLAESAARSPNEAAWAHLGRGFLAEQSGNTLGASEAYRLASEGLSGSLQATALLLYGRVLAQRSDVLEAQRAFSKSLETGAPLQSVLEALIDARLGLDDLPGARAAASLRAATGAPEALAEAGQLMLREGRLDAARTTFREAVARDATNLQALRGLVYVAYYAERRSGLEQALGDLLAVAPADPWGLQVQSHLSRVDTQLLFRESFDREEDGARVLNGWEESEDDGVAISVAGGACLFEGTARGGRTRLVRNVERKLAHLEVLADVGGSGNARIGIEAGLGQRTLRFYIDPELGLCYQVEQSRPQAPVAVPGNFGQVVRLGIDLPLEKRADIQLLVDGQVVGEVKMSGWKNLKKAEIAVFAEAEDGQALELKVQEVDVYIYR